MYGPRSFAHHAGRRLLSCDCHGALGNVCGPFPGADPDWRRIAFDCRLRDVGPRCRGPGLCAARKGSLKRNSSARYAEVNLPVAKGNFRRRQPHRSVAGMATGSEVEFVAVPGADNVALLAEAQPR